MQQKIRAITLAAIAAIVGMTVVASGGGTVITQPVAIPNNSITFAKLQDIASARILGRVTAGTGDPQALSGTEATQLLDTFTSSDKGLAPASGGGTTNYLRADGTWATPTTSSASFVGASAFNSAAQSMPNNVVTLLALNSENFDTDGIHSTSSNTSRLVAPSSGWYLINGAVSWASNSTGYREIRVRENAAGSSTGGTSVAVASHPAVSGAATIQQVNATLFLNAGEYVELFGFQNSGGAINASTGADLAFSMSALHNGIFTGASVYNAATQNVSSSSGTALTLDSESFDTGTIHSPSSNTSRLVAPSNGWYLVKASIAWPANATGYREISIRKNAGGLYASGSSVAIATQNSVSTAGVFTIQQADAVAFLTAGDYVESFGFQNSGSTLAVVTNSGITFSMSLLGM